MVRRRHTRPRLQPGPRQANIDNRYLLDAVRSLCYTDDPRAKALRPVDYRNLGTEELGSVYESLLELHADLNIDAHTFKLATAAGSERKTTGSYYTPTSLIDRLLDDALDPILDRAETAPDPEAALLGLRVLDPACGSGHFLINATHRIAGRLATVRAGGAEPEPTQLRTALRDVIGRCVYGIDINPLAAELCKISLWVEANNNGQPLSYLDHHIVCGNSLLGTTPELIADGIPQTAFKKLTSDDKERLTKLRKRNLTERKWHEQQVLDVDRPLDDDIADLAEDMAFVNSTEDTTVGEVAAKAELHNEIQQSETYTRSKQIADTWCAAFVIPKTAQEPAITDGTIRAITQDQHIPSETSTRIAELTEQYQFLHPHIAFPDIYEAGGFDVVLGNPPWGKIKLQEKRWFAHQSPEIAEAPNSATRQKLIQQLKAEDDRLYEQFQNAKDQAERTSALIRKSGRYPLSAHGDINTYQIFAELMRTAGDRAGMIIPSGIATDNQTKHFFNDLVKNQSLVSLYDFENRKGIFPSIHRSYKFCLLTLSGEHQPSDKVQFVFFAHEVADIDDPEKNFTLTPRDLILFNPNTRTAPIFRNRRDAEITTGIYRRIPVLIREGDPDGNPWNVEFSRMFDMSNDSGLFRTRDQLEEDGWTLRGNHFTRDDQRYLPLYEGRTISLHDHRWATYENNKFRDVTGTEKQDPTFVAQPRYWIPAAETNKRISDDRQWLLGWRRITNATNQRTFIMSPHPRTGVGDKLPQFLVPTRDIRRAASMIAVTDSFVSDFAARQKAGGTQLDFFTVNQLAIVGPNSLREHKAFLEPRLLELCYTAWDMAAFGSDLGYDGPPFRWDTERRAVIRAEIDALMFRIYGIDRPDVDYILDTFPIIRKQDIKQYGEYRTKRLILERYDAMVEADRNGQPYQTILEPPPAHPSVAHSMSTRPEWYRPTG